MHGREKKALEALESAVDKGFIQLGLMKTDSDLSSIRDTDKFKMILSSVKSIENEPEAQKFDFWVGEWNVYGVNDAKVGESSIQKILKAMSSLRIGVELVVLLAKASTIIIWIRVVGFNTGWIKAQAGSISKVTLIQNRTPWSILSR
jgi:hypothetical protein